MANVDWAKNFFGRVTSMLPDLLTKHGEGKEMAALDELRSELGKDEEKRKAERAKELQAELDRLNGKTPPPEQPSEQKGDAKPDETKPEAPKLKR
jgi:hypothetical protein